MVFFFLNNKHGGETIKWSVHLMAIFRSHFPFFCVWKEKRRLLLPLCTALLTK